ncbi:MAG: GMC family oxidoreductase [Pirellulales bacterium]
MLAKELREASERAERHLAAESRSYDAVVVGAGASGGLAAELLTAAGLNVLLLDAGVPGGGARAPFSQVIAQELASLPDRARAGFFARPLLTALKKPLSFLGRIRQPTQSRCYAWHRKPNAYVDDIDCPFVNAGDDPFHWIRCRGIGGRLAVPGHGRIYVRFGVEDFASGDNGLPAWPFPLRELDPWYAAVEKRLGMVAMEERSGWKTTALAAAIMARIEDSWPELNVELCKPVAPPDCLAVAARTGRLALRQGAMARSIEVENGKAAGVTWLDTATGRECHVKTGTVFLCASPLESTRVLLLSRDKVTGTPIGRQSNALGHFLMDHVVLRTEAFGPWPKGVSAERDGEPPGLLVQRFRGEGSRHSHFSVQVYATKTAFGRLGLYLSAFHEMLPKWTNRVTIDPERFDRWGIPVLRIACKHGPAELSGAAEMREALEKIASALKTKTRRTTASRTAAGLALHECGTARMGDDPSNSVLDPHNECWDARDLFVTDASSFPSQGTANPTLTVLALTARACAHALENLKARQPKNAWM